MLTFFCLRCVAQQTAWGAEFSTTISITVQAWTALNAILGIQLSEHEFRRGQDRQFFEEKNDAKNINSFYLVYFHRRRDFLFSRAKVVHKFSARASSINFVYWYTMDLDIQKPNWPAPSRQGQSGLLLFWSQHCHSYYISIINKTHVLRRSPKMASKHDILSAIYLRLFLYRLVCCVRLLYVLCCCFVLSAHLIIGTSFI